MENNYNKLDDFFKKQLADETPDPSWNVPDDSLFENAMYSVNTRRKNQSKKYILILLPILILLSVGTIGLYEYNRFNKINELNLKVAALENTLSSINTPSNSVEDKQISKFSNDSFANKLNKNSDGKLRINEAEVKPFVQMNKVDYSVNMLKKSANPWTFEKEKPLLNLKNPGVSIKTKSLNNLYINIASGEVVNSVSKTIDWVAPDEIPHETSSNSLLSAMEANEEAINERSSLSIDGISILNGNLLPISKIALSFPPLATTETVMAKSDFPKWSSTVAISANNSWLTMANIPLGDMESVKGYDKGHFCGGANLGLSYNFSKKWRLDALVSYNKYRNNSRSSYAFFADENEILTNSSGEKMYFSDLIVMNAIGEYSSPIMFRVDDDMVENELIQESAIISQNLDVLGLNLGLSYGIFHLNRLNIYGGAGMGFNSILRLENTFDVSLFMDDKLMYNYKEETMALEKINTFYFSAYLKAGIDYKIARKWTINWENNYNSGFSSLRDSAPNPGPQTYLHAFHSALGIRYSW